MICSFGRSYCTADTLFGDEYLISTGQASTPLVYRSSRGSRPAEGRGLD
jgi:hypothetical protein